MNRIFVAWSEQQAETLRAAACDGSNQLLDLENLAEEIEGLGISQCTALGSLIRRIIHHLLKLQYSPVSEPRLGWEASITDARTEIEDLLERSPSLGQQVANEIDKQTKRAAKLATRDLTGRDKLDTAKIAAVDATARTEEQVLGDWFPDAAPAEGRS